MPYDIITVTPTLDTSAYAANDVLFTSTAIKLPHSKCAVTHISAVFADIEAADDEIILMFFKENTNKLGTINTAANITGVQIAENVLLGVGRINSNGSDHALDDSDAAAAPVLFANTSLNDPAGNSSEADQIVLVQGTTRNTCYVQALLENSGGVTCAADALVITLHVEY
tara:strand:+ start:549 stop:1058 length:510 start_codon:yes stop_codon:yes gene_type:complete